MTSPQLKTNRDAWQAVHDGIDAGLTRGQIAARWNLSRQMVGKWSRMPKPEWVYPLGVQNHGRTARKPLRMCERCGESVASPPHSTTRAVGRWCRSCYAVIASERARIDDKVAALREHATQTGRVPTVNEARDVIGGSRSRAGDLVKLAFGADPRGGAGRLHAGPRPWPPHDDRPNRVQSAT